ncbi:MAG: hypothetical protein ABI036_10370 [Fibrobacteria bacterium]
MKCLAAAFTLVPIACLQDGGIVYPDESSGMPVLATYNGRALTRGSNIDGDRALNLSHPKIALVWQFLGPSSYGVNFDKISINSNPPYNFSVSLRSPPPPRVAFTEEAVIGKFWLYSDASGNDSLDRITHPKMAAHDSELAILQADYKRLLQDLIAASTISERWIPYQDTFLLDSTGTFARYNGGRPDTLYLSRGKKDTRAWAEILFRRFRLLKNYNDWENFFSLRKKAREYALTSHPMPDHSFMLYFSDWRRLLPLPGREAEFESKLKSAGVASMNYPLKVEAVQKEAQDSGWIDYPFEGFDQPATDWVAGKGTSDFVLYFPTRASLQRVLDAEKEGSFQVDNIEKAGVGYNLLQCDDQYRCKVQGRDDSIYIQLGIHESQFDPPSSALISPIKTFLPVAILSDSLEKFTGHYEYKAYYPIIVQHKGSALWSDIPGFGIHKLTAAGTKLFYAPGQNFQIEFVAGAGGTITKLLFYANGERAAAARSDSVGFSSGLTEEVELLISRSKAGMRPAGDLPAIFGNGADTVRAEYFIAAGQTDSIRLTSPRSAPEIFYPMNDSLAFSASSPDQIRIRRNDAGVPTGLWRTQEEGDIFLPALSYHPRKPSDLHPEPGAVSVNLVSESGGSGLDSYVGLGALRRFGCAEDGSYLRSGDGWILEMHKGSTGDEITLQKGGDGMLMRVPGSSGKRLALDLILCGLNGAKTQRVFLELRGGMDRNGPWPDVLAEADWVYPSGNRDTLSFSPLVIPSDPYFLKLIQVPTLGDTLPYVFDGYRAFSE